MVATTSRCLGLGFTYYRMLFVCQSLPVTCVPLSAACCYAGFLWPCQLWHLEVRWVLQQVLQPVRVHGGYRAVQRQSTHGMAVHGGCRALHGGYPLDMRISHIHISYILISHLSHISHISYILSVTLMCKAIEQPPIISAVSLHLPDVPTTHLLDDMLPKQGLLEYTCDLLKVTGLSC
jgi:hypothetical protein